MDDYIQRWTLKIEHLTIRQIYHLAHLHFQAFTIDLQHKFLHRYHTWAQLNPQIVEATGQNDIGPVLWTAFKSQLSSKLDPPHQLMLVTCPLSQWDVALLSDVCQHLIIPSPDEQIAIENNALHDLAAYQAIVYDRPKKELKVEHFAEIFTCIMTVLQNQLNMEIGKYRKITETLLSTCISSENACKVAAANTQGLAYFDNKQFVEAFQCFSLALGFDRLAPEIRRRVCYLRMSSLKKLRNDRNEPYLISDAMEIAKLEPTHFDANVVLYQYFKQKIEPFQAIFHYIKCSSTKICNYHKIVLIIVHDLAINNPATENSRILLELCDNNDNINLLFKAIPKLKKMADDCSIAKFVFAVTLLMFRDALPEDDDRLSAKEVYNAIAIVSQFAHEPTRPHVFGDVYSRAVNFRVGFCQFLLGLMFETGQHLERSYPKAVKWYKKSSIVHGVSLAAMNLGYLYFTGVKGVPKNFELAKQHWNLALAYGHPYSYLTLGILKIHQLDIVPGWMLISQILKLPPGPMGFGMDDAFIDQFKQWFSSRTIFYTVQGWQEKTLFLEKVISKYVEKPLSLNKYGLSFLDRVRRAQLVGFNFNVKDLLEIINFQFKLTPNVVSDIDQDIFTKPIPTPTIVSEFQEKLEIVVTTFKQVHDVMKYSKKLNAQQRGEIISSLYTCFEASPSITHGLFLCQYYTRKVVQRLTILMKTAYIENCSLRNPLSLQSRFLLAIFTPQKTTEDKEAVYKLLLEGLNKFPDNSIFYTGIAEMFCKDELASLHDGFLVVKQGCEFFPKNYLLFYLAGDMMFQLASKGLEDHAGVGNQIGIKGRLEFDTGGTPSILPEAIEDFTTFLANVSNEHPLYPVACYSLICCYIKLCDCLRTSAFDKVAVMETVKAHQGDYHKQIIKHYKMALASEQVQLPEFPETPAGKNLKFKVEIYLNKMGGIQTASNCVSDDLWDEEIFSLDELQCNSYRYLFSPMYLLSPLRIFAKTCFHFQLKRLYQKRLVIPSNWIKYLNINRPHFDIMFRSYMILGLSLDMIIHPDLATDIRESSHLPLVIIDDVYYSPQIIYFLAQDNQGNVVHVKLAHGATVVRVSSLLKLECGTNLMIVYPQYKAFKNSEDRCIVVRECEQSVVLLGKVADMCRFCGKGNSAMKCSKCERPYCCAGCQQKDFKFMKHKYICGTQSPTFE